MSAVSRTAGRIARIGVKHLAESPKQTAGLGGGFGNGTIGPGGVEGDVVDERGEDQRTSRGRFEVAGQCLAGQNGFAIQTVDHEICAGLGVGVAAGGAVLADRLGQSAVATQDRQCRVDRRRTRVEPPWRGAV